MSPGVHRRTATRLASAAAGLLVIGVVVAVVTGQALPVVLAVVSIATTAIARRTGWRVSVALVILGSMVAEVCLLWITPLLSISVHHADLALWTVAGGAGVVVLATYGPPTLTRPQVETGVLA